MRRRLLAGCLVIGVLVVGARAADAQGLGVKGGVNLSTIKYGDEFQTTAEPGIVAGVFVRLSPARLINLQIEGLVTQRVVTIEEFSRFTLTYVEIPVLVRYPLLTKPTLRVRAQGGASLGVLLTAKEKFAGETGDIKDSFASWDAALAAGAEVEWKDRWVFDVRYLFGVTELSHPDIAAELPAKHRAVQITAGYRF